ncbi:hypothetical protein BO71DRAFT_66275 [Aspergillus ellipticus CBS 707.79]|uniref:Zn(2)-C6 fungal-type domain-containing protein n=1 Tax=Aspergillus ellipticus CBS 707.79 TaxID=1448320 RepID=A0A319D0N2_9EURO|nr:hypothetical protein BO71DRAFT_66275 [Aspergillus ellipticus CBS 707.79]
MPRAEPSYEEPSSGSSTPVEDGPRNTAPAKASNARGPAERRAPAGGNRRSRSGCFTCRGRRKKCDEIRPTCTACSKLGLKCDYKTPHWWATPDLRRKQMGRIKSRIRQTKVMDKDNSLQEYIEGIKALSQKTPEVSDYNFDSMLGEGYNPFAGPSGPLSPISPFDVNVTTQSQSFVLPPQNDFPSSFLASQTSVTSSLPDPSSSSALALPGPSNSSVDLSGPSYALPSSSFDPAVSSTFGLSSGPSAGLAPVQNPPALGLMNPPLPPLSVPAPGQMAHPRMPVTSWVPNGANQAQPYTPVSPGFGYPNRSLSAYLQALIPLEETDRPLLDHFIDHVVRVVLPIPDIYPGNQVHMREIVSSMQNNRSYLHCCLSISAIHLKSSMGLEDQMDHDIMQHRYTAIGYLSSAVRSGGGKVNVLNGTLALIFYHCAVCTKEEYLPDIPWSQHFSAVVNLVKKLNCMPSPFNVSMIAWIDIFGATMTGKTPEFAHTYRTKHLRGIGSGLERLMGCDDRIMYLISEIACLEALKIEGRIDELALSGHISAMNSQLMWTEPDDPKFETIYEPNGKVNPDHLIKILSAIFRIGARIYLYSIIPTFSCHDGSIMNLVGSMADTLSFLPMGPSGFDRCLVWPLFMAGVHSVPSSHFRRVLTERIAALGYLGDFGSFGQMYRALKEVWRSLEGPLITISSDADAQKGAFNPPPLEKIAQAPASQASEGQQPPRNDTCHWREVMRRKNWEWLLM